MAKIEVGNTYGKLTVLAIFTDLSSSGRVRHMAECRCECGGTATVEKYNLPTGNTTQCKQCAIAARASKRKTHGDSYLCGSELGAKCYYTWQAMKRRCYSPSERRYKNYGGRGISVCERWLHSYENFRDDMGLPPSMAHQIDRINNDGNYEPSNCRWVSATDNANNKSSSKMISAFGRTQTVAQWAAEYGIPYHTLKRRLAAGCNAELALSTGNETLSRVIYITELGQFSSLRECAAAHGMSMSGVHNRFKSGKYPTWTIKENQP